MRQPREQARTPLTFLAGLAAGLALALPTRLSAEDWLQFRGPNCSGVSPSKQALPTEFSDTDKVHWSAESGPATLCCGPS